MEGMILGWIPGQKNVAVKDNVETVGEAEMCFIHLLSRSAFSFIFSPVSTCRVDKSIISM